MTNGTQFMPVEEYELYQRLGKNRRIIVAGGRDFKSYATLTREVNKYIQTNQVDDVIIVSGKAKGADSLGELYALQRGLPIKEFPANWDKHGKAAGPIRNVEMAEYATHCIVFWDGKSRGSKHMIDTAQAKGLPTKIIRY